MASLANLSLVVFCAFLGGCNQPSAPATNPQPTSAIATGIEGSCAVTKPPAKPFVPAQLLGHVGGAGFSYGSERLWTILPRDGILKGLVLNYVPIPSVYSTWMMWGREGYDRYTEPHPKLKITGRRLDANSHPLVDRGTEGCCSVTDGPQPLDSFISASFDLPTLGCWEITGRYKEETLTVVIWATDQK